MEIKTKNDADLGTWSLREKVKNTKMDVDPELHFCRGNNSYIEDISCYL